MLKSFMERDAESSAWGTFIKRLEEDLLADAPRPVAAEDLATMVREIVRNYQRPVNEWFNTPLYQWSPVLTEGETVPSVAEKLLPRVVFEALTRGTDLCTFSAIDMGLYSSSEPAQETRGKVVCAQGGTRVEGGPFKSNLKRTALLRFLNQDWASAEAFQRAALRRKIFPTDPPRYVRVPPETDPEFRLKIQCNNGDGSLTPASITVNPDLVTPHGWPNTIQYRNARGRPATMIVGAKCLDKLESPLGVWAQGYSAKRGPSGRLPWFKSVIIGKKLQWWPSRTPPPIGEDVWFPYYDDAEVLQLAPPQEQGATKKGESRVEPLDRNA